MSYPQNLNKLEVEVIKKGLIYFQHENFKPHVENIVKENKVKFW